MLFSIYNCKFWGFHYGKPGRQSWVFRARAMTILSVSHQQLTRVIKIICCCFWTAPTLPSKEIIGIPFSEHRRRWRGARAHFERIRIIGTHSPKPFMPSNHTPADWISQPTCAWRQLPFAWPCSVMRVSCLAFPSCWGGLLVYPFPFSTKVPGFGDLRELWLWAWPLEPGRPWLDARLPFCVLVFCKMGWIAALS